MNRQKLYYARIKTNNLKIPFYMDNFRITFLCKFYLNFLCVCSYFLFTFDAKKVKNEEKKNNIYINIIIDYYPFVKIKLYNLNSFGCFDAHLSSADVTHSLL